MATFLVFYGTGEGQTAKVATRIGEVLVDRGHDATIVDADQPLTDSVDDFDAVFVGSSIHVGKHQPSVVAFVDTNRDALASRPSAFFQVCLSAASTDETRQAEAVRYADEFADATDWHPETVGIFAGALRYSEYGFLKRRLMKRIAREATGDTDASRDYEYTDWDDVERFAGTFAASVEAERDGVTEADAREVRP
ncbi:flavodoxin domain-containing protein [Haladaptatus sp. NG-WS-4]